MNQPSRIENTDVRLARAAGWHWSEIWWERWQARAKAHQLAGELDQAVSFWRRAYFLSAATQRDTDPRWTCSWLNWGAANTLRSGMEWTEKFLTQLSTQQGKVSEWIENMQLATTARSSGFHLRLGSEHTETFAAREKCRYQAELEQLIVRARQRQWEPVGAECRWVIERPPVYDDRRRLASALFLCAFAAPREGVAG